MIYCTSISNKIRLERRIKVCVCVCVKMLLVIIMKVKIDVYTNSKVKGKLQDKICASA